MPDVLFGLVGFVVVLTGVVGLFWTQGTHEVPK